MKSIRVVEDEPGLMMGLSSALALKGYSILAAATGEEAVRMVPATSCADRPADHRRAVAGRDRYCDCEADSCGLSRSARPVYFQQPFDELIRDGALDPSVVDSDRVFFLEKPFLPETLVQMVRIILEGKGKVRTAGKN